MHADDPPVTVYEASHNIATSDPDKNIKTELHFTMNPYDKPVKVELNIIKDILNVESKHNENRQNYIEANKPNKNWNCKKCDYSHSHKGYVMNHIEAMHAPEKFPGYKCMKCCVRVKSRVNFLVHVTKCHKSNDVELKESNNVEKPQQVQS